MSAGRPDADDREDRAGPGLPAGVRRIVRLAARRTPIEAEVDAEIAFHLEMRAAELVAYGWAPEDARAEAQRRFGDVPHWRSAMQAVDRDHAARQRRLDWVADLRQDVRYALRALLRAPRFTLLAVLTLALGIGANAAVFGVVKSVLLDALPYAHADRLVRIYARWESDPASGRQSLSPGVAADLAARLRTTTGAAAFYFSIVDVTWLAPMGPRVLSGAVVEGRLFATLGTRAALGRTLAPSDAGQPTVLLGDAAWRREFAADPNVVGRTLRVSGTEHEIVGVLPPGFVGPQGDADLWFALDLAPALGDPATSRDQHWLGVAARLAPGADHAAAQRELDRLGAALAREHPGTDRGRTLHVVPLRDAMVGETRAPLLVLLASAGLVLVITCANLAGALLSRAIARRQEFAVRVALGARRGRLVRQLLTESTLLALVGGAVGLLLATLALAALRALALPALPPYADLSLDLGAVAVTLLVALGTGLAFGLAPALAMGAQRPQATLRDEGRGASGGRRAPLLRGALVAAQLALSLSLLVGAGLLGRDLWRMANAPLGVQADGLLTGRVVVGAPAYPTPAASARLYERLEAGVAALPGVLAVATTTQLPSRTMSSNVLTIDGVTLPGAAPTFIPYQAVSDAYFRTMGIALVAGRTFGPVDTPDGVPAIVVNRTMARRYWPGGDALGARLRVSPHTAERWGVIVGIVDDVRLDPTASAAEPMAYASSRQDVMFNGRDLIVRTAGDPLTLVRPVERVLATLDPTVPLRGATPLRTIVRERLSGRRLPVLLMTGFGALALALTGVGVYAMFANLAAARERELGVRIALGAGRLAVARLVLRQGATWMALGLLGGVLGAALVTRALRARLGEAVAADPLVFAGAGAVLIVGAALALLGPVRRATRVEPITVLR